MLVVPISTLLAGCAQPDGFLDTPDDPSAQGVIQQRMPSLAGCRYVISDATNFQQPAGLDVTATYDLQGHLLVYEASVGEASTYAAATLKWVGDCLTHVTTKRDAYGDTYQLEDDDFECDEHDQWVSWTETDYIHQGKRDYTTVVQQVTYTNTYDPLGQVVRIDTSSGLDVSAAGLVSTEKLLWDGQGRVLQIDTTDLTSGSEFKRTYTWDHDRLLGWSDKGVGQSQVMTRYFERHRLVEQDQYQTQDQLDAGEPSWTITWTYPDDHAVWPSSRSFSPTGVGFYDQDIEITCPDGR